MLIAIMGNTFATVSEKREISGLQEKVKMINDHIWLINISKRFKGYKYIIRIAQQKTEVEIEDEAVDIVKDFEKSIDEKMQHNAKE